MNNFEKLQSMSVDELAKWLDEYGQFDTAPWMTWWNDNYCEQCESITVKITEEDKLKNHISCLRDEFECAYCEINDNKCKFFPEMEDMPDNVEIIKLWLEEEYTTK